MRNLDVIGVDVVSRGDALRKICIAQEGTPVRRLPTVEDAPGPTACAAADVQEVSVPGLEAD